MKKRNIFKQLAVVVLTLVLTGFANNSFAQFPLRFDNVNTGPTSKTICQGGPAGNLCFNKGSGTYYIEYSLNNGATWNHGRRAYSGTNNITGDISTWNPSYVTMLFRIKHNNTSTYSTTVTLYFQVPASITAQPNSTSVVEGGNTSFSVSATNATSYQWQVSTNGGSSYTNITSAGSNPTYSGWTTPTLSLTGVAASNNNYKYQCIVNGCNTVTSNPATLTVTLSCIAPITQASNISFSTINTTSGTLQWNNGSGTGRVVYINTTNSFTAPANGTTPTANTTYSGSNQQCVYIGTGNSVTVTGLTEGTIYYARVYEYDCTGKLYNTSIATSNPISFSIFVCEYPTAQATSFTSTPYANGAIINWVRGNGDKRLVFVNTTNSFTMPSDGVNYTANSTYSGSGQQCVYNGVGNSVDVKGLNPSTTYYFAVYEFTAAGFCYLANPLTGSATTNASGSNPRFIITNIGGASYSGAFNGNVNSTIYLCNNAGVQLYTNLTDTVIGGVNYPVRWQTSPDGVNNWFTWASQPLTNTDRYIRACRSRLGSHSTDIYNPTPWLHIVHSPHATIEAPTNCTYTYKDGDTYFTVSWTPSTTVDNTGGGLTIKHFICYATQPDYSDAIWIDVTGLTTYTVTGITPGVTYYWKLYAQTYNVGTNNGGDWFCGAQPYTTCSLTSTLPIDLISLNAHFDGNKVIVSWTSATEMNNMNFIVERSINTVDWQAIGSVNGSGNSNNLIEYSFEDNNPINGISYYRLKQVDFNGEYTYYGPVFVTCYNIESDGLSVYPNPASESVFVSGVSNSKAEIVLYNVYGNVIATYASNDVSVPTAISLAEFERGVYFVAVKINEKSKVFKIVRN